MVAKEGVDQREEAQVNNALPPALTPEQWSKLGQFPDEYEGSGIYLDHDVNAVCVEYVYVTQQRHALAALCLYEQPFGFDARDVHDLDIAILDPDNVIPGTHRHRLTLLRDRIASLLPPA